MKFTAAEQVARHLKPFVDAGLFGALEVHAAGRITRSAAADVQLLDALSVASAVWATQQGHVCFDITDATPYEMISSENRPDPERWREHLGTSQIVHTAQSWNDDTDRTRPLVSFGGRIYLARQWIDERVVADRLTQRRSISLREPDIGLAESLFAPEERDGLQCHAVRRSLEARTSVITGGPGTGKTYTIARILVAAVRGGARNIALAAPTAKAAVRMRESLSATLGEDVVGLDPDHRRLLEQLEPTTIHRLLGARGGTSTRFRHDSTKPLSFDLLVIDEMSMVSLPLMARLLEALDTSTTTVLVGDPGQLDSVENGSVLRDLTEVDMSPTVPMTVLEEGHRNVGSRSSSLGRFIRSGLVQATFDLLDEENGDGSLRWIETDDPPTAFAAITDIMTTWRELADRAAAGDVDSVLESMTQVRILCPHREGSFGVDVWNQLVSEARDDFRDRWKPGDIVVKTRNDLGQGLSNGDTGVVVRVDGTLYFAFSHGDSRAMIPVIVDDAVELAFATTVHKAQGSEFETVVVVVPPIGSPLCTRELLYTAVTRAKPQVVLIGSREAIAHAVSTRRRRFSGLSERLSSP